MTYARKKPPVAKKWHSVRRKPSQNVWFSHRPQTDNTPHPRKNPTLSKQGLVRRATNKYRLAKEIGVRAGRISDIEAGRRAITTDNDLRLCKYFGLSEGWWLRGQVRFDTEMAKRTLHKELARIKQCSLIAA